MSEWQEFLIEDLADFCNAKRVPLSSMQRQQLQGSYPYYGASGIVDYVNDYIFEGSHVLISEDGENLKSRNTPIAFEASGKFWVNNHAHILKAKEQHLTKILIHYFAQLDLSPYLTGAVQPKLNKATLSKIPLYLPSSIAEQKAIASVLSSLDDKIDLLHRQNKTLEAMAETLFRQWFIEEAKEDWEEVQLKDLVFVIDNRGKTPPYFEEATDHPIIEVNALTKNGRAIDYCVIRKYVTKETFDTWFRQYLEPLDIVLSTVGSIGSFGMFFGGGGCVAQNIIGLRAQKKISNFFLYQWLVANTDVIKELDIGSVQPSIKVPHLLSLSIKIPMAEKLEKFDNQVEGWVRKILANTKQIQTLENLRNTLLPKLMSGEVRVQYQTEEVA